MRPVRRREGLQRPGRDERRRDEHFACSRRRGVGGDTRTRHSEAFECKGARTYFLVLRWGALGGGECTARLVGYFGNMDLQMAGKSYPRHTKSE